MNETAWMWLSIWFLWFMVLDGPEHVARALAVILRPLVWVLDPVWRAIKSGLYELRHIR